MFNKVLEDRPKFNKEVVQGLAHRQLKLAPYFLERIIKSSIKSINKDIDFKYRGFRRLSPVEDFEDQFSTTSTANIVDVSKSTLHKLVYMFEFEGEPLERVICLPYVEKGGVLTLSNALYGVVPVLSEYVISSNNGEVFVRLMKDKLMSKKIERPLLINGETVAVTVIVAKIYKFVINVNDQVPIAILLFVKYGFDGVFERYFGTKPELFMDREPDEELKKTHTIYQSTGNKPRGLKDNDYQPHHITIAIEKDKVTPFTTTLVSSLFAVFDIVNIYSKNIVKERGGRREPMFWKALLGKIIFKNNYTIDKLLTAMDEYLDVVDGYMDDITQMKLEENNITVTDFYDLIELVTRDYDLFASTGEDRSAAINNRYMDINYYILFEHIAGINKTFYQINKDYKLGKLNLQKLTSLFNKHFSKKMIFNLTKSGSLSIALTPIDASGDNYFPKITSVLEDRVAA